MNKDWDYAKLSKLAKENGGPEALIEKLVSASAKQASDIAYVKGLDTGYTKGVKDTLCVVFILAGLSLLSYFLYKRYIKKLIKQIKETSDGEIETLKQELIDGINNYDNSQN